MLGALSILYRKPGYSGGKFSSFLVSTGIIEKALYHLFRPTITMLLDKIRGFCQPCLLLQIVEPRL